MIAAVLLSACDRSKKPFELAAQLEEQGKFQEALDHYQLAVSAGSGKFVIPSRAGLLRMQDVLAVIGIDKAVQSAHWEEVMDGMEKLRSGGLDYGTVSESAKGERSRAVLKRIGPQPFPKRKSDARLAAAEMVGHIATGLEHRQKGRHLNAYMELHRAFQIGEDLGMGLGEEPDRRYRDLESSVGQLYWSLEDMKELLAAGEVEKAYVSAMELKTEGLPSDAMKQAESLISEIQSAKTRLDTLASIRAGEYFALTAGKVIYQDIRQDASQMKVTRMKVLGTEVRGKDRLWTVETEESLRIYGQPLKGRTSVSVRALKQDGMLLLDYGRKSRTQDPVTGKWSAWNGGPYKTPKSFEIVLSGTSILQVEQKSYPKAIKLTFSGEGEPPLHNGWYVSGEGLVKRED